MKGTHGSLSPLVLLLCLSCQAATRKGPGETSVLQSEDLSAVPERVLGGIRHVLQGLADLEWRTAAADHLAVFRPRVSEAR